MKKIQKKVQENVATKVSFTTGIKIFLITTALASSGAVLAAAGVAINKKNQTAPGSIPFQNKNQLEGYLNVSHADPDAEHPGAPVYAYSLFVGKDQEYPLEFDQKLKPPAVSGGKVKISVKNTNAKPTENLYVENIITTLGPDPTKTTGDHSYLVIPVNFKNNPEQKETPEQINAFMQNEIKTYFDQVSFGKVTNFHGTVTDWVTLPDAGKSQACTLSNILLAQAIAKVDDKVDFTTIDHVVLFVNDFASCDWGGKASLGNQIFYTKDGIIKDAGVAYIVYGVPRHSIDPVVVHELGHNFGLHHANAYEGESDPCFSGGCPFYEYGDPYDAMGNHAYGHFNALNLEKLSWLSKENVEVIKNETDETITQEITIHNLEEKSDGKQLVRLWHGNNLDDGEGPFWYGIDMRSQKNFDDNFTDNPVYKYNIYQGIEVNAGIQEEGKFTYNIDLLPENERKNDDGNGALEQGQSIRTPEGYYIEVLTHDEDSAKIRVTAPPIGHLTADISEPALGDFSLSNTAINVKGSANGKGFSSYELSYGEGFHPEKWNVIKTGTQAVTKNTLGILQTADLPPSVYTFKLDVYDSAGLIAQQFRTIHAEKATIDIAQKIPTSSYVASLDIDDANKIGVFSDNRNKIGNVYAMDLEKQNPRVIARTATIATTSVRIWNSYIVWIDGIDPTPVSIKMCKYDKSKGVCSKIETAVSAENAKVIESLGFFAFKNGWVVYTITDTQQNMASLMAYNILSKEKKEIGTKREDYSKFNNTEVGISSEGTLITRELDTKDGFSITNLEKNQKTDFLLDPSIVGRDFTTSNDRVAWSVFPEGEEYSDIYMCTIDWKNKKCDPQKLPVDQKSKKAYLQMSDDMLAWSGRGYFTDTDIVTYNLTTKKQSFVSVRRDLAEGNIRLTNNYISWEANPEDFSFTRYGYYSKLK